MKKLKKQNNIFHIFISLCYLICLATLLYTIEKSNVSVLFKLTSLPITIFSIFGFLLLNNKEK